MNRIKRSQFCRIDRGGAIEHRIVHPHESYTCQDALGLTPDGGRCFDPLQGTQNLHSRERTRYHFGVVMQPRYKGTRLRLRQHQLHDGGGIKVQRPGHRRSARCSCNASLNRRDGFPLGGRTSDIPPCGSDARPAATSRWTGLDGSGKGARRATARPLSVTSKDSPLTTLLRYTLRFCLSSRTPTRAHLALM